MFARLFVVASLIALGVSGCEKMEQERDTDESQTARELSSEQPQSDPSISLERPDDCRISMGWDPWEPYQYRDESNEVRGLDVEIVSAVIDAAGCELTLVEGEWATLLSRLKDGDVDLLTGATKTPSRESFAYFSDSYRDESFVLYLRSDEASQHATMTLQELLDRGFRVGVTLEYVYGDEISTLADDPQYEGLFDGVLIGEVNYAKLLSLEIDGFLEDPFVASAIMRRKGLRREIEAHPMELRSGEVHLMLSRASVEIGILERINQGLAKIKEDGTYQQILDRYRS